MEVLDIVNKDDIEKYIKENYSTKETYHLIVLDKGRYIRFDIKPRSFIRRLTGKKWNVFINLESIRFFEINSDITQIEDKENWSNYIKSKSTGVKPE